MALGIAKTLEVVATVQDLSVRVIKALKAPSVFALFDLIAPALADLTVFSNDATAVLPELKDLDPSEVGQLGSAAYVLVQAILDAIHS